jgi:hypothetical protein
MQSDLDLLGMSNLNSTDIGTLLNKCNREEVEAWDWSFLYTQIVIWGVAPVTGTTMQLTTGSNVVTDPNAAFTPNMVGWFLSVGATLTTPVIVNAFLDAQDLQLNVPWQGAPSSAQAYNLFPLYYDIYPIVTPLRVKQVAFLTQVSSEFINRVDPSRLSTGGAPSDQWAQGPWTNDSPPHYQIELWPRPSSVLPYIVDGKLGSVDMINPNDWPQVPSLVLEAKTAMYMARGIFASNGNPKWAQLADMYMNDYLREREQARVDDNRRKITLGISATGFRGGINSGLDYIAIHDAGGPPNY